MNHSIHSADRATHLKIVVMALAAAIGLTGLALSARNGPEYGQSTQILKAGKPMMVTSSDMSAVR